MMELHIPTAEEIVRAIEASPDGGGDSQPWLYACVALMSLKVQPMTPEALLSLCLASVYLGALAHEHGWDMRLVQP